MILICSDGVFGTGKWNELKDALMDDPDNEVLGRIKSIAKRIDHDNYSAILISICDE